MRLVVRKSVLSIIVLMSLYYALMELHYYYFVGVNYSRFLMTLDVNLAKYIETKILFVLMMVFSIYVSKKSEFIYSIFIFFSVFFLVPGLVTYSFEDQIPWPLYSTILFLVVLGSVSSNKIKLPTIKMVFASHSVFIVFILITLIPLVVQFGVYLNVNNFLLDDVGLTRSYYDENASSFINYLYNWLVKAILPVFLIYFLINKQRLFSFIIFFILFYLYAISGNKTVYITAFVILFFFYFGNNYIGKTRIFLYALILFLALAPVVDSYILGSHKLKGTFVQRMLFLPFNLNYQYFDFFKDQPLYFAESNFFRWFVDYPYDKPVGFIIAQKYFNATDMNANNGIISDGYMNLGYWGIGINIAIVSAIFLLFNSAKVDSRYLGVFFLMIFLFLSAPILSMFITSGLWLLIPLAMTFIMKAPGERHLFA
jgi:hypothetical protein